MFVCSVVCVCVLVGEGGGVMCVCFNGVGVGQGASDNSEHLEIFGGGSSLFISKTVKSTQGMRERERWAVGSRDYLRPDCNLGPQGH